MKLDDFRSYFGKRPYFTSKDIQRHPDAKGVEAVQLVRWVKEGKLQRLKNGLFTFASKERRNKLSTYFLSEVLYPPAYISLHSALSHYSIIPEAVFTTTSVSTRKTKKMTNKFGTFEYRHLAPDRFFGFKRVQLEGEYSYVMATPEKALLDFIYFEIPFGQVLEQDLYTEGYRFAHFAQLNVKVLQEYAQRYHSPKVSRALSLLLTLCAEDRRD